MNIRRILFAALVLIRIDGSGGTLFDGQVDVDDCVITDTVGVEHAFSGVGACALVEAAAQATLTHDWQDFGFGLFLKRIGGDDTPADFSQTWNFWINGASAEVGLDTYQVQDNDRMYLIFAPWPGTPEPSPVPSPEPSPSPLPSPSPTPSPTPTPDKAVERALDYLRSQPMDAWAVMAFGANRQSVGLDALAKASLQSATDIEKQILGVRAGGANPRSFAGKDLVQLLQGRFGNNQIGEESLLNDDIFGVLALLAAGEPGGAPEIAKTVQTILDTQGSDGHWESIDLTAAAIEALRVYQSRGGSVEVSEALGKARGYLRSHQDQYGGWGENSASTAWAIQAVVALGEDPNEWIYENSNPFKALLRYQHSNGGFGWKSQEDVSAFMTAYAVPALLQQPLPIMGLPVNILVFASPSPSPVLHLTVSPSPRIAGTKTVAQPVISGTIVDLEPKEWSATVQAMSLPTPLSSPSPTIEPAPVEFVPVGEADRRFTFALFGLANMGIGLTIARLFGKLL